MFMANSHIYRIAQYRYLKNHLHVASHKSQKQDRNEGRRIRTVHHNKPHLSEGQFTPSVTGSDRLNRNESYRDRSPNRRWRKRKRKRRIGHMRRLGSGDGGVSCRGCRGRRICRGRGGGGGEKVGSRVGGGHRRC